MKIIFLTLALISINSYASTCDCDYVFSSYEFEEPVIDEYSISVNCPSSQQSNDIVCDGSFDGSKVEVYCFNSVTNEENSNLNFPVTILTFENISCSKN